MDEKIIGRVARTAQTFEGSKPHDILALIDHFSGGEAYFESEDCVQVTQEVFRASRIVGTAGELRLAIRAIGSKIPKFTFDESQWPWARSLNMSVIKNSDKFLLSCRYGLFQADARSIIWAESSLVTQPHKWTGAIRQFCNNRGSQILWAFKRYEMLCAAADDPSDGLSAWLAKHYGYKGTNIQMTPEMQAVVKLSDQYKIKLKAFGKSQLQATASTRYVV